MRLAVNYSKPAEELLQAGKIDFDLFKCSADPQWQWTFEPASKNLPIYLHTSLTLGLGDNNGLDLTREKELLAQTNTRFLNLHLYAPSVLTDGNPSSADINAILSELEAITGQFGAQNVIIENLPFPMDGPHGYQPIADPAAFRTLLEQSGCGFLLDISHAVLTARALGLNVFDYLSSLPTEYIREVHVTGIGPDLTNPDQVTDHLHMTEEDWRIFEWSMQRIYRGDWAVPDIVAFEYGGFGDTFAWRCDKQKLLEQVPRLLQLVRG